MNINIVTLKSPFSFFCVDVEDENDKSSHVIIDERKLNLSSQKTTPTHGQYVAVLWQNIWTRGIITVESNVMIWLVDHGIQFRPDEKTTYVDLPKEYKKLPSRVFEASIHGVVPLEKIMNGECAIVNKVSKTWNKGATDKTQELIKNAKDLYFEPVAILKTKYNNIVLGNLYIKSLRGGVVNIIDELMKWPVFVQRNPEAYIKDLSTYYPNRKAHRACLNKPIGSSELPYLTMSQDTLSSYQKILNNVQKIVFEDDKVENYSEIGSTVVGSKKKIKPFQLTPSEIIHYSDMFVTINGVEYNALQLLINKIKDLEMCEKYQDAESAGRAITNRFLYKNYM